MTRTVNTGVDGLDAAVRAEARKSSKQIGHLPNGTKVSLTFEAEKINVFTTDGETSLTKGVIDDAHA